MIERLERVFTRENWMRNRLGFEAGAAVLYLVVALVEQRVDAGLFGGFAVLLLAAAILLHRIQPPVALAIVAVVPLVLVVTRGGPAAPSVTLWIPVLLAIFGAAAYGTETTRWFGLVLAVLGGLFVTVILAATAGGLGLGFLLFLAAVLGLFVLPWVAGALLRVNQQKRVAQTAEVVVTAQRDELEMSVALEQERNRVARDVHDIVAHSLAVVIAQADGARYAAKKSPGAVDEALEAIASTARGALVDVRSLLTELRHSQEPGPQPGMAEFDALIRSFRESGLDIDWTSYGTATPLSDATGLAVYRIVQEALTNALRHGARTSPVDLEFDWSDTSLTLTVTNDLPAEQRLPAGTGGHGIPGMRERAALAGGSFTGAAGTTGRFRVRAVLPVDRTAAPTQPTLIRPDAA